MNRKKLLVENPIVAATVNHMTQMHLQNPKTGRRIKATTPLRNKEHPLHKKSVSIFKKIKDKLTPKKKEEPKKQSQSDADFYRKQFTGESIKEKSIAHSNPNYNMERTMQKLAKSLGIKSVVSMYTGKGSLSYFLDDDREAKKLQKFLQRSFKRVRLISLDKSKGDTANWVVAADMLGFESVNERVKDPKLKVGQKIRFKNDSRRVYTLKKINVGVRGISDKDDPSGTSYMFVAPGNRKEYFTKKTWNDAVKKGWLQLESVNESDLGLTYKRGKTIKVTHKKSGKELIIIDKPNVKREYEKIGYFAEGQVNERTRMKPQVKKLLKQKGYSPIFGAIDNSKRQLKQMRYSRGEIQDTLISMFGDEDPKILQKIKESINEKKGDFLDSLFPKSKVAKAVKMAHDMGGDMTGAVKKIEKYFKGMTLHSKVRDALRQANESINEKKGVPGSVFTIDTAKKTSELMTKALKKVAPDIRRGQIYHSALGGADRVSIVGKFSLDPKKTWANNILENSRFITFHLDNDGTLEVNVNGYPFEMRRKVQMRKSRNNDIKQVLKRMITHFSMLNKKYPEGM